MCWTENSLTPEEARLSDKSKELPKSLDDIVLTPEEEAKFTPEWVRESVTKAMKAVEEHERRRKDTSTEPDTK